ncbi:MAG: ABC transporter permease [Planctomycetes bacterium]|nr:ABC transporter permease [Planctomycetota bacterium]
MIASAPAALSITVADLAVGGLLVAATLVLLAFQGLGLTREVLWSTGRALLQVLLLGAVLSLLLDLDRWYWVVTTLFLMTLAAVHRGTHGLRHSLPFLKLIALASIGTTVLVVVGFVAWLVLHIRPWHSPLYLVPLAGMVLANAMNGFNLFLCRFAATIRQRRDEVEIKLSLGADVRESVQTPLRDAIRTAMMPLGNLLVVVGVIQVPGIMTGQLFAGASPMTATGFAALMIEAAVAAILMSTILAALLTYRLFFTPAMQLKEQVG